MTSTAIRVVTGPANYYSYPGALQELDAYSHRDRSVIRMTIDHDFA